MNARCNSPMHTSSHTHVKTHTISGWVLYRFGLILGGLAWVFIASTLCGCNSASGWVMNRSGQSYYDRGDYTAARFEFERALMDSPQNPNYAFNVARAMEEEGDMQGAEQMYQHALNIDPSHQPSYHSLSAMLVDEGRDEDARALLSSWAETQPYLPESQLALAEMYETDGNYLAAQQYTQRAMTLKPNNPRAMARMGRIYQQSGNPQLADQWYQQSLSMNPYQSNVRAQQYALYGPPVTPALQMANTMPRIDPSFNGGFNYLNNPRLQQNTYMSGPVQMQSPMASQGWTTTSQMQSMPMQSIPMQQTMVMPNNMTMMPNASNSGMSQYGSTQFETQMPMEQILTPNMLPADNQMPSHLAGGQFNGETVYESSPTYSPTHSAVHPGQPVPVSHTQFNGTPMISSVPAVKAF